MLLKQLSLTRVYNVTSHPTVFSDPISYKQNTQKQPQHNTHMLTVKTCECEQLNKKMSARSKQYDMVVDTELMVLQHEGLTPYDPLTFSVSLTGLV